MINANVCHMHMYVAGMIHIQHPAFVAYKLGLNFRMLIYA